MPIEINALESERFSVVAARIVDHEATVANINDAARACNVRFLTARVDAQNLARVNLLIDDGFRLMDTLVYYRREPERGLDQVQMGQDFTTRLAVPEDIGPVLSIARQAFSGYFGHYHADPMIERTVADEIYVDWARRCIKSCDSDSPVMLAITKEGIVGFLALRVLNGGDVEISLNAVTPMMNRRGIYSKLLVESILFARLLQASYIFSSTQLTNYAVRKVWGRLGFSPYKSAYTLHKWLKG